MGRQSEDELGVESFQRGCQQARRLAQTRFDAIGVAREMLERLDLGRSRRLQVAVGKGETEAPEQAFGIELARSNRAQQVAAVGLQKDEPARIVGARGFALQESAFLMLKLPQSVGEVVEGAVVS